MLSSLTPLGKWVVFCVFAAVLAGLAMSIVTLRDSSETEAPTTAPDVDPPLPVAEAKYYAWQDGDFWAFGQVVRGESPMRCDALRGANPLSEQQVLTYYGNPYTGIMGILGELPLGSLLDRLKRHAEIYDSLNGTKGVVPALHIVYATAQARPGDNGLYLSYVDEDTMRTYIETACQQGFLVFLDLQIGRSSVMAEVEKIRKYLMHPHVHVALDPEFAMPPGEAPGEAIGSLDAADVNAAQALIQKAIDDDNLPDKILIVHQFLDGMIKRRNLIEDYPNVKLVIDMDGFGPPEGKISKYHFFTPDAEYAGIKLFFKHDVPLMTEVEVLTLEPDLIIYQ